MHLEDALTQGLLQERREKYLPKKTRKEQWKDWDKAYDEGNEAWNKAWYDYAFCGTLRF